MLLIVNGIYIFLFNKKKTSILKKCHLLVFYAVTCFSCLLFHCFMLCDGFNVLYCSVLSFSFFLYK